MLRRTLLAAVLVVGPAVPLLAADGTAPKPIPAVSASATTSSVPATGWYFPGIKQLARLFEWRGLSARFTDALRRATKTIAALFPLDSRRQSPSEKGGSPASPHSDAGALVAKEENKATLKIQAIRYLTTLDGTRYPEVIDALMASLDDPAEEVRHEAICALQKRLMEAPAVAVPSAHGPDLSAKTTGERNEKILARLNDLLLERDDRGGLKEYSVRIRETATAMIEQVLSQTAGVALADPEVRPAVVQGKPAPTAASGAVANASAKSPEMTAPIEPSVNADNKPGDLAIKPMSGKANEASLWRPFSMLSAWRHRGEEPIEIAPVLPPGEVQITTGYRGPAEGESKSTGRRNFFGRLLGR